MSAPIHSGDIVWFHHPKVKLDIDRVLSVVQAGKGMVRIRFHSGLLMEVLLSKVEE